MARLRPTKKPKDARRFSKKQRPTRWRDRSLPNFGDERAIADTMRMARLDIPVLVQATPDDAAKMTILHRRDSFCGKMSACNNLRQYGIPYSLTKLHTVAPTPISGMTSPGLQRYAAWPTGCAIFASAASARVPRRSTLFATAKSFWKRWHLHRDSRSLGSLRPHREIERRSRRSARQSSPRSRSTSRPAEFPMRRWSRWRSSAT